MSKSRSRSAQPALLTVSQVASHLSVDPSTVRRWIEDGRLPAVKPGGQWRIHPDELQQLLRVSTPLVRS